ncbi:MAG: hypothetical protein KA712_07075 [Myxococcales bacterium]|nr:hypothetical protein [Myxococcales bacterium]
MTPIAIVGRACVLPGALSPEELWTLVAEGRVATARGPRLALGRAPGADARNEQGHRRQGHE